MCYRKSLRGESRAGSGWFYTFLHQSPLVSSSIDHHHHHRSLSLFGRAKPDVVPGSPTPAPTPTPTPTLTPTQGEPTPLRALPCRQITNMIFGSRARLRRSEEDPFEGVERFAEGFKRRRKPFRKPPRKRVSSRGSVGRTRDSTQERALAPQPRGGDGVTGGVQPPEGLPPLGLTQHGQSSALSTSPEAPEPQLSPQHWNNGTPKNAQLYPIPEDSPSVPPPPVPHPQLITPTGRPPTDEDTDGINLDFLVSGEMRTFRGFYTRLEYHSTVSPRLARLSRHGIQFRPPAAGPGRQATMTLCIPVCIPNVYRGCRERDVVMEVDEFLGAADFCVGVGVLEKIKAVKAGLDLDVGPGPVSLSTGDLTPVLRMSKCPFPIPISSTPRGKVLTLWSLRYPGTNIGLRQLAPRHHPRPRHGRDSTPPAPASPAHREPRIRPRSYPTSGDHERRRWRRRYLRRNTYPTAGIRTWRMDIFIRYDSGSQCPRPHGGWGRD